MIFMCFSQFNVALDISAQDFDLKPWRICRPRGNQEQEIWIHTEAWPAYDFPGKDPV